MASDVFELDESRPNDRDGNLFMLFVRQGLWAKASAELRKLEARYKDDGKSVKDMTAWRAWIAEAREYIAGRN